MGCPPPPPMQPSRDYRCSYCGRASSGELAQTCAGCGAPVDRLAVAQADFQIGLLRELSLPLAIVAPPTSRSDGRLIRTYGDRAEHEHFLPALQHFLSTLASPWRKEVNNGH